MPKQSKMAKAAQGPLGGLIPRCPLCDARLPRLIQQRTYLDSQHHHLRARFAWDLREAVFEECGKCHKQWPRFARDEPAHAETMVIIETDRTEEPIGTERRIINNDTAASVERTIRASRGWTCTVDSNVSTTSQTSAGLNVASVGLDASTSRSIEEHYGVSIGQSQSFEETVSIAVPPHTRVEATLSWKRIWQNGYMEQGSKLPRRPFRVCVGVTFDLKQAVP